MTQREIKLNQEMEYIHHHRCNHSVLEEESKANLSLAVRLNILEPIAESYESAYSKYCLVVNGDEKVFGYRAVAFTEGTKKDFFKKNVYTDRTGSRYFKEGNHKIFLKDFMIAL